MGDNILAYGFRPWKCLTGEPNFLTKIPASSQAFNVTGGTQNVAIVPGDVLVSAVDQGVDLCAGSETTAVDPEYILAGVDWQWDATSGKMIFAHGLASGIAYSTNIERQSKVRVLKVQDFIWEVCCDDAVTATTRAAYQALVGLNTSFKNTGAAGETPPRAKALLDISLAATTNTLEWRIWGISPSKENRDFAGNYVRLLVTCNTPGGSTTGA
jgi:hypothetical protein